MTKSSSSVSRGKQYVVEIPGKPFPSPRPRFARMGRGVRTYMPKEYTDHKKKIARLFPDLEEFDGQLRIDFKFFFKPAPSWSKVKKERHYGKFHTQKPDVDNLKKTVMDAMEERGTYKNDSQVCIGSFEKVWWEEDKTIVVIEILGDKLK